MASSDVEPPPGMVPIVEVAFGDGKWWSIPPDTSAKLCEHFRNNEDAGYTWDWGEGGRVGSWAPDGEETKINRYTIDFVNRVQTNQDSGRKRSIRIVWARLEDINPVFTSSKTS